MVLPSPLKTLDGSFLFARPLHAAHGMACGGSRATAARIANGNAGTADLGDVHPLGFIPEKLLLIHIDFSGNDLSWLQTNSF